MRQMFFIPAFGLQRVQELIAQRFTVQSVDCLEHAAGYVPSHLFCCNNAVVAARWPEDFKWSRGWSSLVKVVLRRSSLDRFLRGRATVLWPDPNPAPKLFGLEEKTELFRCWSIDRELLSLPLEEVNFEVVTNTGHQPCGLEPLELPGEAARLLQLAALDSVQALAALRISWKKALARLWTALNLSHVHRTRALQLIGELSIREMHKIAKIAKGRLPPHVDRLIEVARLRMT